MGGFDTSRFQCDYSVTRYENNNFYWMLDKGSLENDRILEEDKGTRGGEFHTGLGLKHPVNYQSFQKTETTREKD
ncbi:14169_t:CDS:2 [Gigaspora rosea]|nr:14169_t:CDS:2 [Gigaspora rosea]